MTHLCVPMPERRRFGARLALAGLGSCLAPWSAALAAVTADDPAVVRAARWVDRLGWGASEAELARCLSLGTAGYLREQLAGRAGPLEPRVQARIDALSIQTVPLAERVQTLEARRRAGLQGGDEAARNEAREAYRRELGQVGRETAARHLLRAVHSPDQLREHLTWFWLNHFSVFQNKGPVRLFLADYEDRVLRPNALGSFRAMLGGVTRHPAMLLYLDNARNAAGRLNENHARELLELHTLGVDGGYTQTDVQVLARVLTGHSVWLGDETGRGPMRRGGPQHDESLYAFFPARHDGSDKHLLGRTLRARGAGELDEVLDLLAAHPATARHICRKLAQYLLCDEPPADLVQRMAAVWRPDDLGPSLAVLLDPAVLLGPSSQKLKDPMHFVVSALRLVGPEPGAPLVPPALRALDQLGQLPYGRQTPDGYPMTADAWTGSGQLSARFDVARQLAALPGAAQLDPMGPMATPLQQALRARLGESTRRVLERGAEPTERVALLLAAPEFMHR